MHPSSLNHAQTKPGSSHSYRGRTNCEKPLNAAAHQMLADAASSLEMYGTVVFAFETIRLIEPKISKI